MIFHICKLLWSSGWGGYILPYWQGKCKLNSELQLSHLIKYRLYRYKLKTYFDLCFN